MRFLWAILPVVVLITFAKIGAAQLASENPLDAEAASTVEGDAPSQPAGLSTQAHKRRIPLVRRADELAWTADFQYFVPNPGFDRRNRDIDLEVVRAALAAHFRRGLELQFDVLMLRAKGTSTHTLSSPPAPANALGLGAGPLIRWNFLSLLRCRLFADGAGDLFLADRPFPPRGSVYDFLLRAGGGLTFRVTPSNWLEAGFRVAHISNGQGINPGNPAWNGRGFSIGIRHAFRSNSRIEKLDLPSSS